VALEAIVRKLLVMQQEMVRSRRKVNERKNRPQRAKQELKNTI